MKCIIRKIRRWLVDFIQPVPQLDWDTFEKLERKKTISVERSIHNV